MAQLSWIGYPMLEIAYVASCLRDCAEVLSSSGGAEASGRQTREIREFGFGAVSACGRRIRTQLLQSRTHWETLCYFHAAHF